MRSSSRVLHGLALLAGFTLAAEAWAGCPAPIPLPAPGNPSTSVLFGDAVVYSLPLLQDAGVIPSGVQSSPGQINDCIVVGSGSGGTVQTNNLLGSADDAYHNEQGKQNPYFRTGDSTLPNNVDPNGPNEFVGDTATTWDIKLSALENFLQGGSLTFLFNHNQTGSGTGGIDEDLFIWAQVALVDTDTGNTVYFYATAMNNTTGLTNFGLPGGDPGAYLGPQTAATSLYPSAAAGAGTFPVGGLCSGNGGLDGLPLCSSGSGADYMIRARGRVCLDANDVPVPCTGPFDHFINDNLGANEVANAVVFPEINAILALPGFGGFDVMQIDWRMGCNAAAIGGTAGCPDGSVLNNGFEQLFIIGGPEIPTIPEPASVLLVALALIGLAATQRKRVH